MRSRRRGPRSACGGRRHSRGVPARLLAAISLVAACIAPTAQPGTAAPARHAPPRVRHVSGERSGGILAAPAPTVRAPRFAETTRCPWDLASEGASPAGRTVRCGFVLVPEERNNPGGPTLRLAVLVAQRHLRPTSDAIITLQGGPGNTSAAGDLTDFVGTGRDVIVFDQRGVGKSVPALNCVAVGNRDPLTAAHDDQALLASCRDRLVRQGVRLDAYTIPEDAADVDAIRQALGYRQLDLYGLSYGTELALAVMRGFPRTVRSAVLDSVLPTQTDVVADIPANMQHALQQVFGACAADAWCRLTFPDLRDAFSRLVASLDAHPAAIHTGAGILHLGGAQLVRLLYGLLLSSPQQAPAVIYGVKHHDYGPLTQAIDAEAAPSDATAWVMSWSIVCSDGNFGTHAWVRERSRSLWPALRGIVAGAQAIVTLCEGWPVRKAAAASVGPVTSAIPTLVLEGRLDAITPPAYGRAAARTLAHSFYLEFPDRGHIVRGDTCSYAIIAAFLARPAARPGSRCMAGLAVNFAAGASIGTGGDRAATGQFSLRADTLYRAAAPVLHLTLRRLQELLASGNSLADVARRQHVAVRSVRVALLHAIRAQLDAAVRRGSLSRADAARLYTKLSGDLDQLMHKRGGV